MEDEDLWAVSEVLHTLARAYGYPLGIHAAPEQDGGSTPLRPVPAVPSLSSLVAAGHMHLSNIPEHYLDQPSTDQVLVAQAFDWLAAWANRHLVPEGSARLSTAHMVVICEAVNWETLLLGVRLGWGNEDLAVVQNARISYDDLLTALASGDGLGQVRMLAAMSPRLLPA